MIQQSETGVYQVIQNTCLEGLCYYLLGMKIQLKKIIADSQQYCIWGAQGSPGFSHRNADRGAVKTKAQKALGEVESVVGQEWAGILALPLVRRLFYCPSEAQFP